MSVDDLEDGASREKMITAVNAKDYNELWWSW